MKIHIAQWNWLTEHGQCAQCVENHILSVNLYDVLMHPDNRKISDRLALLFTVCAATLSRHAGCVAVAIHGRQNHRVGYRQPLRRSCLIVNARHTGSDILDVHRDHADDVGA